jgi:hypothetical protein
MSQSADECLRQQCKMDRKNDVLHVEITSRFLHFESSYRMVVYQILAARKTNRLVIFP